MASGVLEQLKQPVVESSCISIACLTVPVTADECRYRNELQCKKEKGERKGRERGEKGERTDS